MPNPMELALANLQQRAQQGDPQAIQMLQQLMGGQGGPPQGGPPPGGGGGMPPPGGGMPPPGMGPPPGQEQAMMSQALRGGGVGP